MRFKLTLEYDGTGYNGWQRVDNGPSIQASLELAVEKFCGVQCEVVGAGRTDAGVHAIAQVAHVDIPKDADGFTVMNAINFHLAANDERHRIAVIIAEPVNEEFHARFSATGRSYVYRILTRRPPPVLEAMRVWHTPCALDTDAMHAAAQTLLGTHDFTSFRDTQCQAKSPVKTLDKLDVLRIGEEVQLLVEAKSFLHHQVRIFAGTLVEVGRGAWQVKDVAKALTDKNRTAGGPTAPPHGLYLVSVKY